MFMSCINSITPTNAALSPATAKHEHIPNSEANRLRVHCALLGCASLALVVISYYAYAYPSLLDLIVVVGNVC
jgi:hypothetical protein